MPSEVHKLDCLDLQLDRPVDLIYLDPPSSCESEDRRYGVGASFEDYLSYMETRLKHLSTLLSENGNLLLHADYRAIHYLKVMLDGILGRRNFINEIVWCYSSPSKAKRNVPRKHQTILWYGRGDYHYEPERVAYTGQLKVGGETSWAGTAVDVGTYEARGKTLEDWWTDIPYLCRNEKEKVGYDTQKPLALMERLLRMFSQPGDRVLDPFAGSGSFPAAAVTMNRYAIACDENSRAVEIMKSRFSLQA